MRGAVRAGFTLVEALVSLLLLLALLGISWTIGARMGAAASEMADRSESLATSRATAWILQEELAGVRAPGDLSAPSGDSLSVRAFRGTAIVCGARGPAELYVRWSGVRSPDPTKDSLLALGADGTWSVRALAGRSLQPGACGTTGALADGAEERAEERWTLDAPAPGALLVRLFERGSYHLSDDAFRYRIGAGGRQPLTPGNVDPERSSLTTGAPGTVVLELATRGAHRGRAGAAVRRVFRVAGRW